MNIKKITLCPFAGIINKTFEFSEGMNVILGDNEAGKSTLMKAIAMVLFDPTNQTPKAEEKLLKDVLPLGGGDTVSVELEFEYNRLLYILKKQWGKTRASSFHLINQAPITDPAQVQGTINEMLIQNRLVWENVMFTTQAQLSNTHKLLDNNQQVNTDLDAILQNAIINNAGIAPEDIQNEIKYELDALLNNWDLENNQPIIGANRKGSYDNRHQIKIGKILDLDYRLFDLKNNLKDRIQYDNELNEVVEKIDYLTDQYNKNIHSFLEVNKGRIADFRKRSGLEKDRLMVENECKHLKDDYDSWNKALSQIDILKLQYDKNLEESNKISAELKIAQKKQAGEAKKEKLIKIQGLQKQKEDIIIKQNECKKIDEKDISTLKEYVQSYRDQKTAFDVLKKSKYFNVEVTSINNISVEIKKGKNPKESVDLNTAEPHIFNTEGGFELKSHELLIKVISDDEKLLECENEMSDLEDKIKKIVFSYGFNTYDELKTSNITWTAKQNEIDSLDKQISNLLDGIDYNVILDEVSELNKLGQSRSLDSLSELLEAAKKEEYKSQTSFNQTESTIDGFAKKYNLIDNLNEKHHSKLKALVEAEYSLKSLAALPSEITTSEQLDSFIQLFDTKNEEEKEYKEQSYQLERKKIELEGKTDEISASEYEDQISLLNAEKEQAINDAKDLIKINRKLEEIVNRAPSNPYEGYYNKMKSYLNTLTNGKYIELNIEDSLPSSIKQSNNKEIPVSLLSQGTSGLLGIALRLSMADYFLGNKNGFLIFDDPMTDLDQKRQEAASACLSHYAETKQVILFTCHQSHADRFAGNKINLN